MKIYLILLGAIAALIFQGCHCHSCTSSDGKTSSRFSRSSRVPIQIYNGMTQEDVISSLGPKYKIQKDANGEEMWAYERVSREIYYEEIPGNTTHEVRLILKKANSSQPLPSWTVIIKFDQNQKVRYFAYH